MINKYVKTLEQRQINTRTNYVWTIMDVPATWRSRVEQQIIADGYTFDEDGTVIEAEA